MKFIATAAAFLIIFAATPVGAEPSDQVVRSFTTKVQKLRKFFDTKPISLTSENSENVDGGKIYAHHRFNLVDFSYDIQSTKSLITPYIGYVNIKYVGETNAYCGNLKNKSLRYNYGFSSRELAISRKLDCFKAYDFTTGSQIIFAYQDGKWVLKDINSGNPQFPEVVLKGAFGLPNPSSNRVEDNILWEEAIE